MPELYIPPNILIILGCVAVVIIVLDAMRRMEKLKRAHASLSSVLEQSLNEIYIIDANTWKFIQVNRGARQNLGYDMQELQHMTLIDIMPAYNQRGFSELVQPLLLKEREKVVLETLHQRKDGSFYDIEMHLQLSNYRDRKVFVAIALDITERNQAEEYRLQLVDRLTQSNTELERFAYVASHDMQEPIRMVTNFSQILAEDYGDKLDDEGKAHLKLLVDSGMRMRDMIQDLLAYARAGNSSAMLSSVDADTELTHVLQHLRELIEEHQAEVTSDTLPAFQGNSVQFISLMQNLIANAIKYQLPGNKPHVHIGVEDQGEHWCFSVKDNGIGIEEGYLLQIFEPFQRLHKWDVYKGTGLGLAMCKRIVQNHGGTIWVESTPGSGSVFNFTVAKQQADQSKAA